MLFVFMQHKIQELKDNDKISTAKKYAVTLRQFSRFMSSADIPLAKLTSKELKLFETYLIGKGVVMNTVSFYMRILRAVYNKAIIEEIIPQGKPFATVYTGVARTKKRAIDEKIIRQLQAYQLKPNLAFARDMFLFSFYTRGMSFIDMANLKKEDLIKGVIVYKRKKTGQQILIGIEPCMIDIIKSYEKLTKGSEYLLPLLYQDGTTIKYEAAIRNQNQRLKKISRQMDLSKNLTTYVSRHTWATIARSKGISLPIISEGMGHTSEQTTRIYLSSLDHRIIDRANRKIIRKENPEKGIEYCLK
ncbi:MAG: site-specific integrase [Tannerellaceae bacterium]|jgi:integrase|nr:site-specific integrase [Tannerellaceae bacterium]